MAHISSLLSLDRADLEFCWLLMAGWEGLRPALPATRIAVADALGDPHRRLALDVAADALGARLLDVPAALLVDPREAGERLAPLVDAVVTLDADGALATFAPPGRPSVALVSSRGIPGDVVGHLYHAYRSGAGLRGRRAVWDAPPSPALTSWCEVTGDIPIEVIQVGESDSIDPAFLASLRAEGQAGRFERVATAPTVPALNVSLPPDLATQALATAALLALAQRET